jgi:long-chain acyl-CoA synthetase
MNKPHRLFDCIDLQLQKGSVQGALVAKENGQWRKYSTQDVKNIVDKLSAGLLALGVNSGDMTVEGRDKIAILSKNRPEWIFLDLAVQQIGAILIPIYPTAHAQDISFIINDAQARFVFFNDEDLNEKLKEVLPNTPTVKDSYSFEKVGGVKHWSEILSLGTQEHFINIEEQAKRINTEDLFTINHGFRGLPGAFIISHHHIRAFT